MKAIEIHEFGGPEVMKIREAKIGKPGKGQALIRLVTAGVNFVDIQQRKGVYYKKLPFILGLEGAGVVEEVGEGVKFTPGDRVAYVHEQGSYAEACLVRADLLIPLPKEFSFEQGASFPLQGMTAHYLLHEFRKPKPGDVVLIHAAAGGMGLLLVQWAKRLGAKVIGTVSNEEKAQAALEAGADHIIIYIKADFVTEVKNLTNNHGADLIIDGVGKATFAGNLEAAALKGHIVIFGAASGPADPIPPNSLMPKSLSLSGGSLGNFMRNREEMIERAEDVIKGIQEGWLNFRIHSVLKLDQAAEAHRQLENRKTIGKLLLATGSAEA